MKRALSIISLALLIAACQPNGGNASVPGDASDHAPFAGIAPDDTIHFTGTEPFWGGETTGERLTYSTPDDPQGTTIAVKRFAGRGGLSLSGAMNGQQFDLTVTTGQCSDGMSDRTYPFVVTLLIGGETRNGCAWTDAKGFTGPENP